MNSFIFFFCSDFFEFLIYLKLLLLPVRLALGNTAVVYMLFVTARLRIIRSCLFCAFDVVIAIITFVVLRFLKGY